MYRIDFILLPLFLYSFWHLLNEIVEHFTLDHFPFTVLLHRILEQHPNTSASGDTNCRRSTGGGRSKGKINVPGGADETMRFLRFSEREVRRMKKQETCLNWILDYGREPKHAKQLREWKKSGQEVIGNTQQQE